jgi:hypothetical protein
MVIVKVKCAVVSRMKNHITTVDIPTTKIAAHGTGSRKGHLPLFVFTSVLDVEGHLPLFVFTSVLDVAVEENEPLLLFKLTESIWWG